MIFNYVQIQTSDFTRMSDNPGDADVYYQCKYELHSGGNGFQKTPKNEVLMTQILHVMYKNYHPVIWKHYEGNVFAPWGALAPAK